MNQNPVQNDDSSSVVRAGDIYAIGVIHLVWRAILRHHEAELGIQLFNPQKMVLPGEVDAAAIDGEIFGFLGEFPLASIFRGDQTLDDFIQGEPGEEANLARALQEAFLISLANRNPAVGACLELLDISRFSERAWFRRLLGEDIEAAESRELPLAGMLANLAAVLLAPARLFPDSLRDQLTYILETWGHLLGDLRNQLLTGLDVLAEEHKSAFGGPGPTEPGGWITPDAQEERFSVDREWMAGLVLIAKNTYVWLAQLSESYGREIRRLDEIPDAELDRLAGFGISGLWLIGLWERSPASRKIKRIMGDDDAEASAYSLLDYVIASDLGGFEALANLRWRAGQRGIRLASDMVPNHMGIDSRWVIEHPDRFLSLPESPYPTYSFNGVNLSDDARASIFLEDHYYQRSDASVVFLRVDNRTGARQYIYHGNDGTSMPWNDTAQLNYLLPEVREAVIRMIVAVAREFPIIRFDAAMTLAKKHIQRLWFPEPGTGGAIPSRAGRGMPRKQFDELIPVEFWREVVERVAAEAPDTLLLAEAFWMMEGYFVRTLGLHRVYNSAFMHMLRDERNREYRAAIKNTLAYNPEVLKRFVNFLNNPDEETAREQFGTGAKYFGVATLMATLPGLPMVGHGQLEGFSEKYGMEFRRPRRTENEDPNLIAEHARQIFPLFRKRSLFAGTASFRFYDAVTSGGKVEEDVFAYLNGRGGDAHLVLFHNRYAHVRAKIRQSVAFKDASGDLRSTQFAADLGLADFPAAYLVAADMVSGLEYVWSYEEVVRSGLGFELEAYETRVLHDFRVIQPTVSEPYGLLCEQTNGRGVPSIAQALLELERESLIGRFADLANPMAINYLADAALGNQPLNIQDEPIQRIVAGIYQLIAAFSSHGGGQISAGTAEKIVKRLKHLIDMPRLNSLHPLPGSRNYAAATRWIKERLTERPVWLAMLSVNVLQSLEEAAQGLRSTADRQAWYRYYGWSRGVMKCALDSGSSPQEAESLSELCEGLICLTDWMPWGGKGRMSKKSLAAVGRWFEDPAIQRALGVNDFFGKTWFSEERMEGWLSLVFVLEVLRVVESQPWEEVAVRVAKLYAVHKRLLRALEHSEFQVGKFLEGLAGP
ncbi:MAG: alpha-amylase [Chloroflexi bacterium]|nr:alpha-amylase [Chloroflexota bacterium]